MRQSEAHSSVHRRREICAAGWLEGGELRALEIRELREELVEERARILGEERAARLAALLGRGSQRFAEARHGGAPQSEDASQGREDASQGREDASQGREAASQGRLQRIERALSLLATGVYGTCAHCGRPIATAWLRRAPGCERCADCEEPAP